MKKLLFVFGVVLLAAVVFAAGLVLGTMHDFLSASLASYHLGDEISLAGNTLVVLEELESGRINDAKAFLNTRLDGAILGIDRSLPYCPEGESATAARNLLVRISRHRSQHPVQSDERIDKKIREILNKAEKQKRVGGSD